LLGLRNSMSRRWLGGLSAILLVAACAPASVEADRPGNDGPDGGGSAAGDVQREPTTDDDATGPVLDAGVATPVGDAGNETKMDGGSGPARSAGCATGAGLAAGVHTFTLDATARRYVVRLPTGYTKDKAWPVVLALHPNGSSAAYWDATTGAQNIRAAVAKDAVLVIPEAIGGNWRDYAEAEATWPARLEKELRYTDRILSTVRAQLCVKEDAIFAMGFSGGGSFAGVLACRRTDIRAFAAGGAVVYFDKNQCVGKSAPWITIGAEELIPARVEFRDFFRTRSTCATTSKATTPSPCVAYDGCAAETPTTYCQHAGGHVWPMFGTTASWQFFKQFVGP
jgi:poly(3-hydroxybutyrate) depolymerase